MSNLRVRFYISTGILSFVLLMACAELRDTNPVASQLLPSYNTNVKQLLSAQCVSCHGGVTPAGDYDLSAFLGILDTGTDDIPNAIPGEVSSLLLRKISSSGSMNQYIGSQDNEDLLISWVVDARLGLNDPSAHPKGWTNVADKVNFHGSFLQKTKWNISACTECHGTDYKGGIAERSCLVCHTETPENCTTCHGRSFDPSAAPPKDLFGNVSPTFRGVGAHKTHLKGGNYSNPIDCQECHIVPSDYSDDGHIDDTDFAEVTFGAFAALFEERLQASPVKTDLTCSNVYCHGAFPAGNHENSPTWNIADGSQAACGTCHGVPPNKKTRNNITHPSISNCEFCHSSVVEPGLIIKDKSKHINGVIDF